MLKPALLAALLLLPAGLGRAALPAHAGGPAEPIHDASGRTVRTPEGLLTFKNWSGYALANYLSTQTYTQAAGTWTVPSVVGPPKPGYSATWVGIGGFCKNSAGSSVDQTLIQLGTGQNVTSTGAASYNAWWAVCGSCRETVIPLTIHASDSVTASLSAGSGSSPQTWTLTMTDNTTTNAWSTSTVSYASSLLSAEWVEEAPSIGSTLPLADFHTVTFDTSKANSAPAGLTSGEGFIMQDPHGQTSDVSAPDTDGDGFNACWGSKTFTSCSAASS